jgi:hypothetical protein
MFKCHWLPDAAQTYREMRERTEKTYHARIKNKKAKISKIESLFKQVRKTIELLKTNPRHPGLQTHVYDVMAHPFHKRAKVFEAYVQNHTAAAYRIFWCYGPEKDEITILAITSHP